MSMRDDIDPLVIGDMVLRNVLQAIVNRTQHLDDLIPAEFLVLMASALTEETAIPIDIAPAQQSLRCFKCFQRHCLQVGCVNRRACVENRPDLPELRRKVCLFDALLTLFGGHQPYVIRVTVLRHVA